MFSLSSEPKSKRRRNDERSNNGPADASVVHWARKSDECAAGEPLYAAVGIDRRDPAEAEGNTFGVGPLVHRRRSRYREHRAEDDPRFRRLSARAISGAISRAG